MPALGADTTSVKLEGITLRGEKGSPLTHQEMDENFIALKIMGADYAEKLNAFANRNNLPTYSENANSPGWYRVSDEIAGGFVNKSNLAIGEFITDFGDVINGYDIEVFYPDSGSPQVKFPSSGIVYLFEPQNY